jgi:hypothetical protein
MAVPINEKLDSLRIIADSSCPNFDVGNPSPTPPIFLQERQRNPQHMGGLCRAHQLCFDLVLHGVQPRFTQAILPAGLIEAISWGGLIVGEYCKYRFKTHVTTSYLSDRY